MTYLLSAQELADEQRDMTANALLAARLLEALVTGNALAIADRYRSIPTAFYLHHMRIHTDMPLINFDNGDYRLITGGYGRRFHEDQDENGFTPIDLAMIQAAETNTPFVDPSHDWLEVSRTVLLRTVIVTDGAAAICTVVLPDSHIYAAQ